MSGYSPRPLVEKLGLKPGMQAYFGNAPESFIREIKIPLGVQIQQALLREPMDFIHCFMVSRKELSRQFPILKNSLAESGVLWISWPKRSAKVATDLDENIVREIGLNSGLVDVKVVAVDEIWSGLKFMYRKKDREK
jgi:hypothetical protein